MFRGYWSARPSLDICQRPSFAHQLSARAAAQRATPGQNVTLDDVRRAPTGERRGTLSVDLGSPNGDTRAELAACFGPLPQQNSCSDTKSKDNSELRSEGGNSKSWLPLVGGCASHARWAQAYLPRPGSSAARVWPRCSAAVPRASRRHAAAEGWSTGRKKKADAACSARPVGCVCPRSGRRCPGPYRSGKLG
eukprot:COSAG06_NODE_131_length_22532_cov_12.428387_10_plen_193_part_00